MEIKEDKEETKTQNTTSQVSSSNVILEEFMNLFDQMLSQIKYNLQSFNKKCDSMDRCFNNILLLKTDKPFDEDENQEDEYQKQIDYLYSEYNPNNSKKQNKKRNRETLKITSKELNNIEKMFEDMNENGKKQKMNMNNIEKKKKPGRAPTKYMYEIDQILKGGKIKNDEKINNNNNKKIKKYNNKGDKMISLDEEEEDDQFIDHIILDKKIEKYTQFKEILKKFEENKKDEGNSDYENIDDDLDLDFDE